MSVRQKVLLLAILVGFLVLSAFSSYTKQPTEDESWFGSASYHLALHGSLANTVLDATGTWRQGMARHFYWQPPLSFVLNAFAIRAFGFSLMTVRMVSAAAGAVALLGIYFMTAKLTRQPKTGLIATVLAATDYFFVLDASDGRMDTLCLAFGLLGLAAFCLLRERSLPLAILVSHSAVAASGLTHPNGIIWLTNLVVLTLFLERDHLRASWIFPAMVPYLLAALAWGAFIAQEPADFRTQFLGNIRESGASNYNNQHPLETPLNAIGMEVKERYLSAYGLGGNVGPLNRVKGIVLLIYAFLIGSAGFLARRIKAAPLFLSLTIAAFFAMTFLTGNKMFYYLTHITPLFAIVAALVLNHWSDRGTTARMCSYTIAAILVTVQLAGIGYRLHQDSYHNQYKPMLDAVLRSSGPQDAVIGTSALIWDLAPARALTDDYKLGYLNKITPRIIVISEFYKAMQCQADPAVRHHIEQVLERYERVPLNVQYEVYRAR
ncbi:MAG: glycosyltransferase family 39 protein [Bryobacteraceae bacterium]